MALIFSKPGFKTYKAKILKQNGMELRITITAKDKVHAESELKRREHFLLKILTLREITVKAKPPLLPATWQL
jgi:hypothetical protein